MSFEAYPGKKAVLGFRLRFYIHPPQELAIRLMFHQQAADDIRGNLLGEAAEEVE